MNAQSPNLKRLTSAIGAELSALDLRTTLADAAAVAQLRALAVAHGVLVLPEQPLEPTLLATLARAFGEALPHPAYPKVPAAPSVQVLESTPDAPSKIELWHSDMTFAAEPPDWTLVQAQIVPAVGGDTLWASATAAYEALSTPLKRLLEPLQAVHDFRQGFRESLAEPGGNERLKPAVAANPPVRHPVVREHPEDGQRALYVNPLFTTAIDGLSRHESDAILSMLFEHQVQAEFTVRLRWRVGTIVIWDNRTTLHKPVNDFFPAHRKLHRVTIRGREQPSGPTEAR
ncbi:MAG: TauD/TfdA family dioxygenase [Pseudomonadota bacterium]